jgi:hypothetical protein
VGSVAVGHRQTCVRHRLDLDVIGKRLMTRDYGRGSRPRARSTRTTGSRHVRERRRDCPATHRCFRTKASRPVHFGELFIRRYRIRCGGLSGAGNADLMPVIAVLRVSGRHAFMDSFMDRVSTVDSRTLRSRTFSPAPRDLRITNAWDIGSSMLGQSIRALPQCHVATPGTPSALGACNSGHEPVHAGRSSAEIALPGDHDPVRFGRIHSSRLSRMAERRDERLSSRLCRRCGGYAPVTAYTSVELFFVGVRLVGLRTDWMARHEGWVVALPSEQLVLT